MKMDIQKGEKNTSQKPKEQSGKQKSTETARERRHKPSQIVCQEQLF